MEAPGFPVRNAEKTEKTGKRAGGGDLQEKKNQFGGRFRREKDTKVDSLE